MHDDCIWYERPKRKGNRLTVRVPTHVICFGRWTTWNAGNPCTRATSGIHPPTYSEGGLRGTQVTPIREPPLGSIFQHDRKVDYVERRYTLYESYLWDPLFHTLGIWTTWNAGTPCTRATSGIHIFPTCCWLYWAVYPWVYVYEVQGTCLSRYRFDKKEACCICISVCIRVYEYVMMYDLIWMWIA